MSFDKTKAMRSAERFLTQGKIRSAIEEYKKIVEDNPKDYSTLNILGDLYIKNTEEAEAIKCYMQVAEYYHGQGFSNKAIAIYNKISKIVPNSLEVSGKLAHLYQMRGSFAEARFHYGILAENYENTGRKLEAIVIWSKIAELDPRDTKVYLKIAEASLDVKEVDDAAEAFTKAGLRFSEFNDFEAAIEAFKNALEIKPLSLEGLSGFVKTQINLGCADEALNVLKDAIENDPYNRDVEYLLVDCYTDLGEKREAEKLLIRLVEQEPAKYPLLVELVESYSKENDLESAIRVLSVASEYLLTGGQAVEFHKWTNEILARNPESIDALRMLVRYHTWQRDETEVRNSLERLAETAKIVENFEEENNTLTRLMLMYPQEEKYAERVHELKVKYDLSDSTSQIEQELKEISTFETVTELSEEDIQADNFEENSVDFGVVEESAEPATDIGFQTLRDFNLDDFKSSSNGSETFGEEVEFSEKGVQIVDHQAMEIAPVELNGGFDQPTIDEVIENSIPNGNETLNAVEELKLYKEIESIEFYLAQEYIDIAVKSFIDLEKNFGQRKEFEHLREQLSDKLPKPEMVSEQFEENIEPQTIVDEPVEYSLETRQLPENFTGLQTVNFEAQTEFEVEHLSTVEAEPETNVEQISVSHSLFDDFRNDLGLEEAEEESFDENDYETNYQTAIAYKEMGLLEDAIKEFQVAIDLVEKNDGTRRFFQCANLLGHCFMEKGMPSLAVTWYARAIEVENLNKKEVQAMNYELANAFEANGDFDESITHFKKIYAEDVEYRDVCDRLSQLHNNLVEA